MSITTAGHFGEQFSREWLLSHGYSRLFQPDWIASNGKIWIIVEAKHQDRYSPPPFTGHGLPRWQVEARLNFQKIFNIRAMLLILDKGTKEWFWQWLDILENGQHFDTNGNQSRRIYPIINFHKEYPQFVKDRM